MSGALVVVDMTDDDCRTLLSSFLEYALTCRNVTMGLNPQTYPACARVHRVVAIEIWRNGSETEPDVAD
jgi:hypothetical protein